MRCRVPTFVNRSQAVGAVLDSNDKNAGRDGDDGKSHGDARVEPSSDVSGINQVKTQSGIALRDRGGAPTSQTRGTELSDPFAVELDALHHDSSISGYDEDAAARGAVRAPPVRGDELSATLLASARHELRSPLQSIQGFAELLGSEAYGPLSEEQHTFVEHILQGSLELGSVLEACLELADLQLQPPPPPELTTVDLKAALSDALELANQRAGTTVQTRYGNEIGQHSIQIERTAFRRAFQALLSGLAAGNSKILRADVTLDPVLVRLTLSTPKCVEKGPLLTTAEFARRRRATRSLVWLQLAAELLALQDGLLLVSEPLDCVEVRLRLSSTH
ncbi:MAG: multi-sensor hybrid histidine kinase [Myxococcaceae bacterium]|nr:multi-sensor hybrid histidine kinase [Myxococcaceae bacterium]